MQKQGWIEQKQAIVQAGLASRQEARLEEGAQIPFWGNGLLVRFEAVSAAFDQEGTLVLPADGNALKQALKWRRKRAEELLAPRVAYWAERTGIAPAKISYGNASRRWGSMSMQGGLRLNTALVHVPPEMADYVIVHELAHLRHPDHSPAFHAYVRAILPGADQLRQEMKKWAYVTNLWK